MSKNKISLSTQVKQLNEIQSDIISLLEKVVDIVEETYLDQHTAGTMPGSGFSNRGQRLSGRVFGWRNSDKFYEWKRKVDFYLELKNKKSNV